MMMQLSPLYGVPSYTDEHANPRNFTVEKLLHALEYLRCRNLSAEEEVFIRHQHDCEMMRLERPLLFTEIKPFDLEKEPFMAWRCLKKMHSKFGQAHESLLMLSNTHAKSTVGFFKMQLKFSVSPVE
jgi:hypothetical protein